MLKLKTGSDTGSDTQIRDLETQFHLCDRPPHQRQQQQHRSSDGPAKHVRAVAGVTASLSRRLNIG